jgi:hypothetical protein
MLMAKPDRGDTPSLLQPRDRRTGLPYVGVRLSQVEQVMPMRDTG